MKTITPARRIASTLLMALCFIFIPIAVSAQTSAFSYQGRLSDGAQAASGTYDLQFALFDAEAGGTQSGATLTKTAVNAANGIFSVSLDFGASPFAAGANRFLQIAVKKPSETTYTTLAPRQPLSASPYSIRTISAAAADSLSSNCVGCISSEQINSIDGAKVSGTVNSAIAAASAGTATTANTATTATTATNAQQLGGVAASNYLQTNGSGASVTNLNASNLASGTIPDARLSTDVTLQGNSVNGANQLVKLDGNGKLPAIDGSQLTNLSGGSAVTPLVVIPTVPGSTSAISLASYGSTTRVFLFSFGGFSSSNTRIQITLPPANAYPAGTRMQTGVIDNTGTAPTVQYERTSTTTDTLHGFNLGAGSAGPGFNGAFATWITDGSSNWYKIVI